MGKFKIGRKTWVVAAVCCFLAVAVSLGMIFRAQAREQEQLEEILFDLESQLSSGETEKWAEQIALDEGRLAEMDSEIEAGEVSLRASLEAIERSRELYDLAERSKVDIVSIASEGIQENILGALSFSALSLTMEVKGPVPYLVSFISALSLEMPTIIVESVSLDVPLGEGEWSTEPKAKVKISINSYRGGENE